MWPNVAFCPNDLHDRRQRNSARRCCGVLEHGQNEQYVIEAGVNSICQGAFPESIALTFEFVLFGAVAVVLVATTTTLVGREWQYPLEQEPVPLRRAEAIEETEAAGEAEEEPTEENQENLNVLHLLYTIAQVLTFR